MVDQCGNAYLHRRLGRKDDRLHCNKGVLLACACCNGDLHDDRHDGPFRRYLFAMGEIYERSFMNELCVGVSIS